MCSLDFVLSNRGRGWQRFNVVCHQEPSTGTSISIPGGGGDSIYPWVGRCGAAPHTLTLFKTNIADFPTLFKTEFRFLIPCLRHLTQFKTKIDKSIP